MDGEIILWYADSRQIKAQFHIPIVDTTKSQPIIIVDPVHVQSHSHGVSHHHHHHKHQHSQKSHDSNADGADVGNETSDRENINPPSVSKLLFCDFEDTKVTTLMIAASNCGSLHIYNARNTKLLNSVLRLFDEPIECIAAMACMEEKHTTTTTKTLLASISEGDRENVQMNDGKVMSDASVAGVAAEHTAPRINAERRSVKANLANDGDGQGQIKTVNGNSSSVLKAASTLGNVLAKENVSLSIPVVYLLVADCQFGHNIKVLCM